MLSRSDRNAVLIVAAILIGLFWILAGGGGRGLWVLAVGLAAVALPFVIDLLLPWLWHHDEGVATTLGLDSPRDDAGDHLEPR